MAGLFYIRTKWLYILSLNQAVQLCLYKLNHIYFPLKVPHFK
jgi:hypothetical protein